MELRRQGWRRHWQSLALLPANGLDHARVRHTDLGVDNGDVREAIVCCL